MKLRHTLSLIAAGAFLAVLILGYFGRKSQPPLLTSEALKSARALWKERAPQHYTLEIQVSGATESLHHIEVQQSQVIAMKTNGIEEPLEIGKYWSVPALFDMLELELASETATYLDAQFEPNFGYPLYFRRQTFGSPNNIEWKVTNFSAIE